MNATVSIVCYKSKKLANGEHPLMIRISKDYKTKYQSLGISINPDHWDFNRNRPKPDCPNRDFIMKLILDKEAEFQNKIVELAAFQKEYTAASLLKPKKNVSLSTVEEYYLELISYFTNNNRRGNASIYKDSLSSIKNFKKGKVDFFFDDIDIEWLNDYESWMRSKRCKETTISLQFRTLRSAYNKAVENNKVKGVDNPFKKFKISKFNTKTAKRAISKEDMIRIMNLDLSQYRYYFSLSRDIFIFSYLCGGINFSDMAMLRMSQISKEKLVYSRKKTKKVITIPLKQEAIAIINRYADNKEESNKYVFPILDKDIHITEQQKINRIHKTIAKVNSYLKEIAKIAGIEANLTTYVARHTHSSFRLKTSELQLYFFLTGNDLETSLCF
ncbi:tyrosine recombinase [Bacteroidia bacterium]|nr:tyrosine recombinase [Bacteroidia bacterium]